MSVRTCVWKGVLENETRGWVFLVECSICAQSCRECLDKPMCKTHSCALIWTSFSPWQPKVLSQSSSISLCLSHTVGTTVLRCYKIYMNTPFQATALFSAWSWKRWNDKISLITEWWYRDLVHARCNMSGKRQTFILLFVWFWCLFLFLSCFAAWFSLVAHFRRCSEALGLKTMLRECVVSLQLGLFATHRNNWIQT